MDFNNHKNKVTNKKSIIIIKLEFTNFSLKTLL